MENGVRAKSFFINVFKNFTPKLIRISLKKNNNSYIFSITNNKIIYSFLTNQLIKSHDIITKIELVTMPGTIRKYSKGYSKSGNTRIQFMGLDLELLNLKISHPAASQLVILQEENLHRDSVNVQKLDLLNLRKIWNENK